MRHRVVKKKLASDTDHNRSLLNNLSTELILKERIETTLAKAKLLRPHIEKLVTYASRAVKSGDKIKKYNAVKELGRKINLNSATKKLLEDIAGRFANTPGGYTRVVKVGNRSGDNADMARIEFTKEAPKAVKPAKKAKVEKAAKKDEE